MVYEVLIHSSGGERFTIERDASLADGDTFEQDSESYRVLAIQPGHGPFDGVIEAEWLARTSLSRGPRAAETIDRTFQAFCMFSMRSASR
jgi:hypothetical protein